jgi:hypothetical protein
MQKLQKELDDGSAEGGRRSYQVTASRAIHNQDQRLSCSRRTADASLRGEEEEGGIAEGCRWRESHGRAEVNMSHGGAVASAALFRE